MLVTSEHCPQLGGMGSKVEASTEEQGSQPPPGTLARHTERQTACKGRKG